MEIGTSMSRGKVAYKHDIRKSYKENIDQSLSKDNIVLVDNLNGMTVAEYTNAKMQPYIDEYNAKQKRSDRKIDTDYVTYFNNLAKSKRGELAYETVHQFGDRDNLGGLYYSSSGEQRERLKNEFADTYKEWLEHFQERFPHLEILCATIHFDEPQGTPHLHLIWQPIGDNYKQGLSHQVSIGNALSCDGIGRVGNRAEAKTNGGFQMERLYSEMRNYQEDFLIGKGYDIKAYVGGEHKEPDVLKAEGNLMSQKETTTKYLEIINEKIENLKSLNDNLEKNYGAIVKQHIQGHLPCVEYDKNETQINALESDRKVIEGFLEDDEWDIDL